MPKFDIVRRTSWLVSTHNAYFVVACGGIAYRIQNYFFEVDIEILAMSPGKDKADSDWYTRQELVMSYLWNLT